MSATPQFAPVHDFDWQAVEAFATQDIIQCPQPDELFMSAMQMRGQGHGAWRVLHIKHRPIVPYLLIAKVFAVSKNAVRWH
jgi:hypothetical protein